MSNVCFRVGLSVETTHGRNHAHAPYCRFRDCRPAGGPHRRQSRRGGAARHPRHMTGGVTIQPLNHATLVLSQGSHVIYVDPAKVDFTGQPAPTAILITHEHGDHFDPDNLSKIAGKAAIVAPQSVADKIPEALKAQVTVMKNGDTGTVDGLPVMAIPAYNLAADKQQYHPKGRDNGYVLTFGDKKIYIAGDT